MSETIISIPVSFEDAQTEIWESDLILLRNRKGRIFYAAKACRWDDRLYCVQVRKYHGVTAVPLEQLVRRYPGLVDVCEVNPQDRWNNYDRQAATRSLKNIVFSREDCRNALLKTLWNWFLNRFRGTSGKRTSMPHGAEAIRQADRNGGGVDPVPERINDRITASDLETSPFYRYRFTLK